MVEQTFDQGMNLLQTPETRPVIPKGELWVYPHNLKSDPLPHDVELHPYGQYKFQVTIPEELVKYWKSPNIVSEVSTRSTLAQSKIHTENAFNTKEAKLDYIISNYGASKLNIPQGHKLEIGVPFFIRNH